MVRAIRSPLGGGLLGGLVAGLGMLGLRSLFNAPSLQELIAQRLLRFLPPSVFELLLQQVWSLGKVLAVAGVTLLLALGGGGLALVCARLFRLLPPWFSARPVVAALAAGLSLWAIANLVLLPLLDAGLWGRRTPGDHAGLQVILLAGFGLYGFALTSTVARNQPVLASGAAGATGFRRRAFLTRTLGWAIALAASGSGVRFLVSTTSHGLRGFASIREEPGEMLPEITPVGQFYQVTKNLVDPDVSASSWRLAIDGMIDRPFTLTLAELRSLPSSEQIVTLECIENPVGGRLLSNAIWKGVRLRDLLERAGVRGGASRIVFRSADGYEESLPLDQALRPEVIVVYDMNGEPLTKEHGFPARLIVPGRYGMKGPKWLQGIGATQDATHQGYWEKRGWDNDAFVKTTSQIILPRSLDPVPLGQPVRAGGVAFSGDRGISRVELSTDAGASWREANLAPALSPYSWVLWTAELVIPDPRRKTVKVRAYDGSGVAQIAADEDSAPSGATGLQTRTFFNIKEAD